jgi:hypothetical protein
MSMERESGSRNFPLWLIGDSNPKNWHEQLSFPLDSRHPARHNIWTPILDIMQDRVYREAGLRIETRELYVRNAIEDASLKPANTASVWSAAVEQEVHHLAQLLTEYRRCLS